MKPRLLLLLLFATSTLAAADAGKAPADRPRLTDEMRRSVAAAASDSTGQAATTAQGNDTLMMAPVRVTGVYQPTGQRPGEGDPKSQPFNWTGGGTFLKDEGLQFTTELKTQYNARHKGWDLLSFSW